MWDSFSNNLRVTGQGVVGRTGRDLIGGVGFENLKYGTAQGIEQLFPNRGGS